MMNRKDLKWLTIEEFCALSPDWELDDVKKILNRAKDPNDEMNTHFVIPIKTAFCRFGTGIYVHPEQFERCMYMADGSEIKIYSPEFALIAEDTLEKTMEDGSEFDFYDLKYR